MSPARPEPRAARLPSLLQPTEPEARAPVDPNQRETDPGYYKSDGTFITLRDCPRGRSDKARHTGSSK